MRYAAPVALMFACTQSAWAQAVVQGRVLGVDSAAVAAAHVELVDSAGSMKLDAVTDSTGAFRIPLAQRVKPGLFFITAQSLGYVAIEHRPLQVAAGERVVVIIRLSRSMIVLQPVNVVAHRRYRPDVNEEFADRAYWIKRTGMGRVLERDELQRMAGMNLVRAVSQVPGVRTERVGGNEVVRIRGCIPVVYLDNMKLDNADLSSVLATSLEGIEVYRGAQEAPPQYAINAGTCGVILAWTSMRVEDGRPLTWRRVALALGLGLFVFLLLRL